jgi:hypothetical protein
VRAGSIPTEFGELINLNELWLQSNKLNGTPPFAHFTLFCTQIVYHLLKKTFHLCWQAHQHAGSSFALAGSIPTEFGELINLTDLRLFSNNLTGTPRLLIW